MIDHIAARKILSRCKTLNQAETELCILEPVPSRPMRWGMWDGWMGRPKTYSGLVAEHHNFSGTKQLKIKAEYLEGFELGRQIYLNEIPT